MVINKDTLVYIPFGCVSIVYLFAILKRINKGYFYKLGTMVFAYRKIKVLFTIVYL